MKAGNLAQAEAENNDIPANWPLVDRKNSISFFEENE